MDRAFERPGAGDEALLSAVIDTVVDGVIIIDRRGIIRVFNPAAENLFGYTAAEAVGRNVKLLMPADVAEHHDGYIDAHNRTGRNRIIGLGREVKGQRKDGTIFPMNLAIGEIAGSDPRGEGGSLAYVGIVRDITEQKKTYGALTEARVAAERASHAKTEFLLRMSEELRMPMRAILSFAQLLEAAPEELPPEAWKGHIQAILGPARRLAALIDDALDIARIESDARPSPARTSDRPE